MSGAAPQRLGARGFASEAAPEEADAARQKEVEEYRQYVNAQLEAMLGPKNEDPQKKATRLMNSLRNKDDQYTSMQKLLNAGTAALRCHRPALDWRALTGLAARAQHTSASRLLALLRRPACCPRLQRTPGMVCVHVPVWLSGCLPAHPWRRACADYNFMSIARQSHAHWYKHYQARRQSAREGKAVDELVRESEAPHERIVPDPVRALLARELRARARGEVADARSRSWRRSTGRWRRSLQPSKTRRLRTRSSTTISPRSSSTLDALPTCALQSHGPPFPLPCSPATDPVVRR